MNLPYNGVVVTNSSSFEMAIDSYWQHERNQLFKILLQVYFDKAIPVLTFTKFNVHGIKNLSRSH